MFSDFIPCPELNVTGDVKIMVMDIKLPRVSESFGDPWNVDDDDDGEALTRRGVSDELKEFAENRGFEETIGCVERVWYTLLPQRAY